MTFFVPCKQNICEGFHQVNNMRRFGWSIFDGILASDIRDNIQGLNALHGKYKRNRLTPKYITEMINTALKYA